MANLNEQQLLRAASAGDTDAQFELAMAFAHRGDAKPAVAWMTKASDAGSSLADAQLGIWQIMGLFADKHPRQGLKRVRRAAKAGDDIACLLLAGLNAMGTLAPQDWSAARDWLIESARRGNPRALTQISLLLPDAFEGRATFAQQAAATGYSPAIGLFSSLEDGGADLEQAKDAIDLAALAAPMAFETVSDSPRLLVAKDFLPPSWCAYIRALAEPALAPSDVHNATLGRAVLGVRTSAHMAFGPIDTDPLLAIVAHRIAAWTGTNAACGEDMSILRYRPGEEYRRHVDFFDPDVPTIWTEAERAGQRTATVLVWLNDDYEGGETIFPLVDRKFRGKTGDALAFWNVLPDGTPDRRTVHAGLPPVGGDKWLISKWIRNRAQYA